MALVLGLERGEYVVLDGKTVIQVVGVGSDVRLSIDAPREVRVERGQVWERTHEAPRSIQKSRAQEAGRLVKKSGV